MGEFLFFKVFFPDTVQQRCLPWNAFLSGLWSRTSNSLLVEAFKIFSQDRAHPHLLHLQLVFVVLQMGLVKGFFSLFPKFKKGATLGSHSRSTLLPESSPSTPAAHVDTWVDGDDVWIRIDSVHGPFWKKLLSDHVQWYPPLFSSSTELDIAVKLQRQVVDIPVMAQLQIPLDRLPQRFPSCGSFVRCSMSLLRRSSRFVRSRGRRSRSHSCSSISPGQVVARPLCATTSAHGRRCSSSMVVNVLVIMRDSGSAQFQVIANLVDLPARNRDKHSTLSSGSEDGFSTHFASFFALLRLSRS